MANGIGFAMATRLLELRAPRWQEAPGDRLRFKTGYCAGIERPLPLVREELPDARNAAIADISSALHDEDISLERALVLPLRYFTHQRLELVGDLKDVNCRVELDL
jgi:hypothetical protein